VFCPGGTGSNRRVADPYEHGELRVGGVDGGVDRGAQAKLGIEDEVVAVGQFDPGHSGGSIAGGDAGGLLGGAVAGGVGVAAGPLVANGRGQARYA
jgi:hypothetical protein